MRTRVTFLGILGAALLFTAGGVMAAEGDAPPADMQQMMKQMTPQMMEQMMKQCPMHKEHHQNEQGGEKDQHGHPQK